MVSFKKTIALFVVAVIAIAALAMPFGVFGTSTADAQYTNADALACISTATTQIRIFGSATVYADPSLTQAVTSVDSTTAGKSLQKFLVCPGTATETSVQIVFNTTLAFVDIDAGQIVPRAFRDSQ